MCLLVRGLIDSIAVSHVVGGHYDVRPAPTEGRERWLHRYGLRDISVLPGTLALPGAAPEGQGLLASR